MNQDISDLSDLVVIVTGPETIFGVGAVEQANGAVRGSMPTGARFAGPDGRAAVGALGVLVDNVLGYSIISSLPPASWSVSTEIWIDLVASLPDDGGRVWAEARIVQRGSFSTGQVVDDSGRVLAECRERGRQVDGVPDFDAAPPQFDPTVAAVEDPGLAGLIGLECGAEVCVLNATPELENPRRMLHGGVTLAGSEVAATRSRVEAGSSLPTSSLHIVHTRPIPAGARVEFRTTTVHAGRSLWLTDVVGIVDGKVCTTTRVTAQAAVHR